MLNKIPEGFVKMDMTLTFNAGKEEKFIENGVLKMLVRDFYIFYTKRKKFKDKWVEFDFYCQPKNETMIAYRFGIYAQTLFKFQNKKDIDNAIHTTPTGFPDCIRIKSQN